MPLRPSAMGFKPSSTQREGTPPSQQIPSQTWSSRNETAVAQSSIDRAISKHSIPAVIPDSQSPAGSARHSRRSKSGSDSPSAASTGPTKPPCMSERATLLARLIPDSSDEVRRSNKSPKAAEILSSPDSLAVKPSVQAMPRKLPEVIMDTSEEVHRSNEDPQDATQHTQSDHRTGSTQTKPAAVADPLEKEEHAVLFDKPTPSFSTRRGKGLVH